MSGVDLSDQLVSYLPLHRKTVKWWKKLALHLITLAMIQAHILHNKYRALQRKPKWKLEKFVRTVCRQVVEQMTPAQEEAPAPAPAPEPVEFRLQHKGDHWSELIDQEEKEKGQRKKQLACVVCYARAVSSGASRQELKNKTKKTSYQCELCKKPLCPGKCHKDFHTLKQFA